jgi:hypothetical protein
MDTEIFLSIIAVVCFFGCIFSAIYFAYLSRRNRNDTIISLVEKEGSISPELTKLMDQQGGPRSDFRKGLIWIAISLPLTVGLAFEDGMEAAAFGLIPFLVGVAYLIVMRFGYPR